MLRWLCLAPLHCCYCVHVLSDRDTVTLIIYQVRTCHLQWLCLAWVSKPITDYKRHPKKEGIHPRETFEIYLAILRLKRTFNNTYVLVYIPFSGNLQKNELRVSTLKLVMFLQRQCRMGNTAVVTPCILWTQSAHYLQGAGWSDIVIIVMLLSDLSLSKVVSMRNVTLSLPPLVISHQVLAWYGIERQ